MEIPAINNGWDNFFKGFTPEQQQKFENDLYQQVNTQINKNRKSEKQAQENLKAAIEGRLPEKV